MLRSSKVSYRGVDLGGCFELRLLEVPLESTAVLDLHDDGIVITDHLRERVLEVPIRIPSSLQQPR